MRFFADGSEKQPLTHHDESFRLLLWLSGFKLSCRTRIPRNPARGSCAEICRWLNGFGRHWSALVFVNLSVRWRKNLRPSASPQATNRDRRHQHDFSGNRAWVLLRSAQVILIDSNIPMYLVGSPSPQKTDAQRLLERLVSARQRLVTDAEVLQEILHRYAAINRRHDIQLAFDALLSVVDDVLPVDVGQPNAQNRSSSAILASPRAMLCISPSWSATASSAF